MTRKVLFVDDEPKVTQALKRTLRKEPYQILSADSAHEALDLLTRETVDVVISDEKMPGMTGSHFLSIVARQYPETIRIILTGHANLETAVHAINEGGIYRFMMKPVNEVDLTMTIRQALQHRDLMVRAMELMKRVERQSTILENLEREYPGITTLETDAEGAIILDDDYLRVD